MNILHHKSWHVLRKDNIARVRRDEAKAAEAEKNILDRQILAENERRLEKLRARSDARVQSTFGMGASSKDTTIQEPSGHVNLFKDWEEEERKNLGSGNKEYEEEKAKEKKEWESKMGIQVYFADGSNEISKSKHWYENIPTRKRPETKKYEVPVVEDRKEKKKRKRDRSPEDEEGKKKRKKSKKEKKHRERESKEDAEKERKRKIAEMREERIRRERQESARTHALLNPEAAKAAQPKKPRYSSQFNPGLSR